MQTFTDCYEFTKSTIQLSLNNNYKINFGRV